MVKDIEPDLPALFEALEENITLISSKRISKDINEAGELLDPPHDAGQNGMLSFKWGRAPGDGKMGTLPAKSTFSGPLQLPGNPGLANMRG
jgi:hypothetical protein